MTKISLETFCNQWVKKAGLERSMVSRFEKNVFDFTTIAGERSKMFFQSSFSYGGLFGEKKWAPRKTGKSTKSYGHNVLLLTKTLRDSIKGKARDISRNGRTHVGKKIFSRGAKYEITTEEYSNRRKNNRAQGGKYAHFHNYDHRYTNFTVNQYSSEKPTQRQFIGFSLRLDQDIEKFYHILFRGFPND